jgi:hypothetical protein
MKWIEIETSDGQLFHLRPEHILGVGERAGGGAQILLSSGATLEARTSAQDVMEEVERARKPELPSAGFRPVP